MRTLAAVLITLLALAACGDDSDGDPSTNASVSPGPSASPSATAHVTPSPTSPATSNELLIFIRSAAPAENFAGQLWVSDLAGTQTMPLTPDGIGARFVALIGNPLTGEGTVYYLADMTNDSATIYKRSLPGGAPKKVVQFQPWDAGFASAAVSPNGLYLAYADRLGLQRLDLQASTTSSLVAGGNFDGCMNLVPGGGSISDCLAYSFPFISPDGSDIVIHETYYEGGAIAVVDPALPGAKTKSGGCCGGFWSPAGDAYCSWGGYDSPTGVYVSREPDWSIETYLSEFASPPPTGGSGNVTSCSWLDSDTLALGISNSGNYPNPDYSYAATLDLLSGALTTLTHDSADEQCCGRSALAAPNAGLVFTQYLTQTSDPNVNPPSQPAAITISTGETHTILQPGDSLLTIVTP